MVITEAQAGRSEILGALGMYANQIVFSNLCCHMNKHRFSAGFSAIFSAHLHHHRVCLSDCSVNLSMKLLLQFSVCGLCTLDGFSRQLNIHNLCIHQR